MITLERAYRLLDTGFSLTTIDKHKKGNYKWQEYQSKQIDKAQFKKQYEYSGGYTIKSTGLEMQPTNDVAIITGYNNVEVIDVDLKVLATLRDQQEFWNELLNMIETNIDDYKKKFVIVKTRSKGYHILYRCLEVDGNEKIASLKGHKEAIIESRGVGGYVVVYDDIVGDLDYTDIQLISEEDRHILWSICRMYNHIEPVVEQIKYESKKEQKIFEGADVKPIDDFNSRNSVWDIVGDEFNVVAKNSRSTIIVRHGAKSFSSGHIYNDTGLMYLFSTATHYPHQRPLNAFTCYAYRYHNGDIHAAVKQIYSEGYGSRVIRTPEPKITPEIEVDLNDLEFPIDIFPKPIQAYLLEAKATLDSNIDYMGVSLLWMCSVIIGNSIKVKIKNKWVESCTLWIAAVGRAGVGKTPSMGHVLEPLEKLNGREVRQYMKQYEKWMVYNKLTESEKKNVEHVDKPKKSQFIFNDITIESLVDTATENLVSSGIMKDELNGWVKDMNKYRQGSDLEFWLSSWSGKSVYVNRITRAGSFLDKPFFPVLGGIQPSVLMRVCSEDNKENGFVDRLLISYPEIDIEYFNDSELPYESVQWFSDAIQAFYSHIRAKWVVIDQEGDIEPYFALFSPDAREELKRCLNSITDIQNSEEENEYTKSMLPKQKSYLPRFALILHVLDCFIRSAGELEYLQISRDSMLKAEKLSKYFIAMAKKVKNDTTRVHDLKSYVASCKGMDRKDIVKLVFQNYPETNKSELSELLGVSRQMLYKYMQN